MQSIRCGSWFLSLFVLTVAACGSSSNAGPGGGGSGGSGGQAGSGSGGGGAGGQVVGGSGGQTVGGSGGQARGGSGGGGGGAGGSGATFPCPKTGSAQRQCQHGLQYCRTTSMGEVNCVALPAACGSTPSCSCVPLLFPACDSCTQSASGDLEVFLSADCPI